MPADTASTSAAEERIHASVTLQHATGLPSSLARICLLEIDRNMAMPSGTGLASVRPSLLVPATTQG